MFMKTSICHSISNSATEIRAATEVVNDAVQLKRAITVILGSEASTMVTVDCRDLIHKHSQNRNNADYVLVQLLIPLEFASRLL